MTFKLQPQKSPSEVFANPEQLKKVDVTGLGLLNASRIINEQGDWLDLKSQEEEGATFFKKLPLKEREK